ncbi:MAG: hypothetical protein NT062_25045 [Proteobacteria bacterium]|nr:hypothetical protein [Pseudomonadota bacterium]
MTVFDPEFLDKFERRVDRAGSCHHWTGATTNGLPSFRGKLAARIAFEIVQGPIPVGRHVRRRCSGPLCVRAAHLTVDTAEHVRRPSKKLSRHLAEDVRVRHAAGETVMQLAESFGISRQHVHGILSGRVWTGDGTRKPKPGSIAIVGTEFDGDGTRHDKLACGHILVSTNWPNRWRRCRECSP